MLTTAKDVKNFIPSDDMIKACELVLLSITLVETIKPIVNGYQQKILNEMNPKYDKKWTDRVKNNDNDYITDIKHTYLMSDEDFKIYLKKCNDERKKAKLHVENEEFCPLLVAEHNLVKAKHLLCDSMEDITGLKTDQLTCLSMDKYNKYIDITLKLLTPFVGDSKKVLSRII